MASLTGNAINTSYQGLIKTTDNGVVGATEKQLTDGEGNALPLTAGTAGVSFTGDVDFTSATVTGLPSGSAGLENGTGSSSLQSAASLTTTAANASGTTSIALGNDAVASNTNAIAIGNNVDALSNSAVSIGSGITEVNSASGVHIGCGVNNTGSENGIAIGKAALLGIGDNAISIGSTTQANSASSVSIGVASCVASVSTNGIAIGNTASARVAPDTIAIGRANDAYADSASIPGAIAVGYGAAAHNGGVSIGYGTGGWYAGVAIGCNASSNLAGCTVAIGNCARVSDNQHYCAMAIGAFTATGAAQAVALGAGVTASKACTVTVKELETCVAGGGITMKSANSTEYKLTVANDGSLQVGGNDVAKKVIQSTSAAVSTFDADTVTQSLLIPAGTFTTGDIIRIKALAEHAGTGSYLNMWINSSAATGGAPLASAPNTSAYSIGYEKTIKIESSTATKWFDANYANEGKNGGYGDVEFNSNNIDWTVDQYINWVTYVNTGDSATIYFITAEKLN